MDALPAILEYGLTGLAAIIVLLAYRLLLQQSKKEDPQMSMLRTIRAFMVLGILLALISSASNYVESTSQVRVEQLKNRIDSLRTSLNRVEQTTTEERRALNRLIADHFYNALRQGAGKIRAVPAAQKDRVRCALVRRAVFEHMRDYEASAEILQNALDHFVEDRGFRELRTCAEEMTRNFEKLRTRRLRWLLDQAIPAIEKAEATASSVAQQQISVPVELPREFVINREQFGIPTVTITDKSRLETEVDVLKRSMESP